MDIKEKQIMEKQSDHDILITLVETVKNHQVTVVKEFQDVKDKVEEVRGGISAQVQDHEIRLKGVEKLLNEINLPERIKEHEEMYTWKKNFQFTWRFMVASASIIGALTGFLLSLVTGISGFFHK